jgi:hypothetical protein
LHWSTEVVSWSDGVTSFVQVSAAFAAPWHCWTSTVDPVSPVFRSRLLVTVTLQATAWPPTLSVPLHCLTAAPGAGAAAVTGVGAARAVITGAGATAEPVGLVRSAVGTTAVGAVGATSGGAGARTGAASPATVVAVGARSWFDPPGQDTATRPAGTVAAGSASVPALTAVGTPSEAPPPLEGATVDATGVGAGVIGAGVVDAAGGVVGAGVVGAGVVGAGVVVAGVVVVGVVGAGVVGAGARTMGEDACGGGATPRATKASAGAESKPIAVCGATEPGSAAFGVVPSAKTGSWSDAHAKVRKTAAKRAAAPMPTDALLGVGIRRTD